MNVNWLKVIIGAVFEVLWVIGLKHADDLLTWAGTIISIGISFYLMIIAAKKLPVGTVYAILVGLGTIGTTFSGIIFFEESFGAIKIILILILLAGVIGMKVVTKDQDDTKEGSDS